MPVLQRMTVGLDVSTRWRWAVPIGGLVVSVTALLAVFLPSPRSAQAHGTMESPMSRIYRCRFVEDPANPTSPACREAVAIGGVQPLYDWNEVNLSDVAGKHRQRIPDGHLCSAGRDKYRGFDQARADWPATRVTAGAPFGFKYRASASHKGTIDLYVTRDGYDPTRPLRWADLENTPFLSITEEQSGQTYSATAPMPAGKSGRHLIYAIWQRSDSPEAFYSCSDVDFGGAGQGGAPAPQPNAPAPQPTRSPEPVTPGRPSPSPDHSHHDTVPASPEPAMPAPPDSSGMPADPTQPTPPGGPTDWQANATYPVGAQVRFDGRRYMCRQAHTSAPDWQPTNTPALWVAVSDVAPGQEGSWEPQVNYPVGTIVVYRGRLYECRQAHMSLPGWDPLRTPALWDMR
jgi:chitin-binding protein